MDSILEFEQQEIKHIKKLFKSEEGLQDLFTQYAPQLFETAFLMLLSTGAKTENFTLLKQIEESEDETMQQKFDVLLEIVLNICAQTIKMNVRGNEEMSHVLSDLGIKQKEGTEILKAFQKHCVQRLEHVNNAYEDQSVESAEVDSKTLKKFPLNFSVSDEMLCVSNPRLVDVQWDIIHTLSSKNLNKIFEPRF